jgi:hypothetical protein
MLSLWQKEMGFTYESAAKALGIGRSTYGLYIKDGAPLAIRLACAALKENLQPIGGKNVSED